MKFIIETSFLVSDQEVEQGVEYSGGVILFIDDDSTLRIELDGIGYANIPLKEAKNLQKVITDLLAQMIEAQKPQES
jgi:hypothetical protein